MILLAFGMAGAVGDQWGLFTNKTMIRAKMRSSKTARKNDDKGEGGSRRVSFELKFICF